jgi:hypothetical protein
MLVMANAEALNDLTTEVTWAYDQIYNIKNLYDEGERITSADGFEIPHHQAVLMETEKFQKALKDFKREYPTFRLTPQQRSSLLSWLEANNQFQKDIFRSVGESYKTLLDIFNEEFSASGGRRKTRRAKRSKRSKKTLRK